MASKLAIDLSGRRNVHVTFPKATYVRLKIATFERGLTIQDVVGGLAALVASEDDAAVSLLDELAARKRTGTLNADGKSSSMSDADRDLLYKIMEGDADADGGEV